MRQGRPTALVAVVAAVPLVAACVTAQGDRSVTIGEPADSGARILAIDELTPRARDLTIESPAVGTVQVRLLLPAGFDGKADATFPTLTLLHGGGGSYVDWSQETDVEGMTAPTELLVVMPAAPSSNLGTSLPEGGPDGAGGPPNWEAFHIEELPQLLERNYRASDTRAIAGLSLGGWGAVMSAAQHPERFEAVASFSGALDLTASTAAVPQLDEPLDYPRDVAEANGWGESNPINLVKELDGLELYISYGNGEPGEFDDPEREPDPIEAWIGQSNSNFTAALQDAGVGATVNAYGEGTHSWPYWERELANALPLILEALATD